MQGLEPGELINVLVDIAMLPVLVMVLGRRDIPRAGFVLAAALCIASSHVCTIVEGFALPALFDALEHLLIAAAGLILVLGYYLATRDARTRGGRP